jgi:hypothetical protein
VLCSTTKTWKTFPPDLAKTQATAVYAGFWLRVVAALVDMLAMYMPLAFTFFLVMVVTKLVKARKGYDPATMFLVASPMAISVGTWLYFAVMESSPWQIVVGYSPTHLKIYAPSQAQLVRVQKALSAPATRYALRFLICHPNEP